MEQVLHLDIRLLWVQDGFAMRGWAREKILGTDSLADLSNMLQRACIGREVYCAGLSRERTRGASVLWDVVGPTGGLHGHCKAKPDEECEPRQATHPVMYSSRVTQL